MNETSSTDDFRSGPVDDLDRLLSGFFKGQMQKPWPAAPLVGAAEPSALVTVRAGDVQTSGHRAAVIHDSGSRARLTLAASVALLLGTGWFLSSGFQPGERFGTSGSANPGTGMLGDGTAGNPKALETLRDDKAKNGDTTPRKIEIP